MALATLTVKELLETEYVYMPIVSRDETGALTDPTGDDVEVVFCAERKLPEDPEWIPAEWVTIDGAYYARVLVGPDNGDVDLEVGSWWEFAKITDSPETPIVRASSSFRVRGTPVSV